MAKKKAAQTKTVGKSIKAPALQVHAGLTQFDSKTVAFSEETARAIARLQAPGGKGTKPSASDVVFARAMPLLGKKLKIKGQGKRVEMELSLPLAIWRFIETIGTENGCDQDAVIARIVEGK